MTSAPFPTGPDALFVCYAAPAEIGCFVELGWPLPQNILDLYVAYRLIMNINDRKGTRSMITALSHYRLHHIDVKEKTGMRELAMRGAPWSTSEMIDLIAYCATDVTALLELLPLMLRDLAGLRCHVRRNALPGPLQWSCGDANPTCRHPDRLQQVPRDQ
jgi:DNA polymerase-1